VATKEGLEIHKANPPKKGNTPGPNGLKETKRDELAEKRVLKRLGKGDETPKRIDSPAILPFENTLAYAFRHAGGKETAINAARLLVDVNIKFKRFVFAYDSASNTDKQSIVLEDLCRAADMSPGEFLAEAIPALWNRSADIAKITAAIAHPRVVEATIDQSMSPFGTQEKKMLLEASGFLPTKSGITIDNRHQTLIANRGGSVEMGNIPGLPSFEDDGIEASRAIRGDASMSSVSAPKAISAPAESIIDAEVEEVVHVQS
jgi:hypothetical protein